MMCSNPINLVHRFLGDEVFLRDGQLLLGHISGNVDNLHPVPQRLGDGVQHVCRANEQHLGQVDGHVQVVVKERVILFGI